MVKRKYTSKNNSSQNWGRSLDNSSFSSLLDAIDPERDAQRQEHLRRMGEIKPASSQNKKNKPKRPPLQRFSKKPAYLKGKAPQKKDPTFNAKLDMTMHWLETTFPDLFDPAQPCKALDIHIIRDLKNHYSLYATKNNYPNDLIIKAALYRYMETPEYLECLKEGAPRYNINNEIVDYV